MAIGRLPCNHVEVAHFFADVSCCAYRRLDLGDRASHGRVSGNDDDDDDDDDDSSDREQQDRCEAHRQGWLCGICGDRGVSFTCLRCSIDREAQERKAMLIRISPAGDHLPDLRRLYIRWQCCPLAPRRHFRPPVPIRSISFDVHRISSARSNQTEPNTHTHTR
jgi:hypothetical protein